MSSVEIIIEPISVNAVKFRDLKSGAFFDWAYGAGITSPILRKIGKTQYTMIGGLPDGKLYDCDPHSMVIPLDVTITVRPQERTE